MDHIRKPNPKRIDPIRSWATLFTAPWGDGADEDGGAGHTARSNGGPSLGDVVSRSVDLGYRVIDDYIQQGEKAARRLTEQSVTPQTMVTDAQDFAARFAQHASGLAAIWLEIMQLTATGAAIPFGMNAWNPLATPQTTPRPERPNRDHQTSPPTHPAAAARVRIEIVSAASTEVVLEIQPAMARRRLIVYDLRAVEPDVPRISDVTFRPETDDAPAHLQIRVAPHQPPGVYNAVIVDEHSSRPVGSVSVTVHGGQRAPA